MNLKQREPTEKMSDCPDSPAGEGDTTSGGIPDGAELDDTIVTLSIDVTEAPVRLDQWLAAKLPDLSRARIQKLIDDGMVQVDEKITKRPGLRLKGAQSISLLLPPAQPVDIVPEKIALDIIFDDEHIAVINKPAGMVTHPGAGVTSGTLVNALMFHLKESLSGISGEIRPGIVHRLDKDTSGLIVVAKNDAAHRNLADQIKRKEARRIYLALVEGVVEKDKGSIDAPVGRHPVRRTEMAIVKDGRAAVTHYKVLKRWSGFTLIEAELETGRTHQIRVHMASIGFPVAGDIVYNKKKAGSLRARHKLGFVGHALHAHKLILTHPASNVLLEFEAPLPPDFRSALEALK